MTLLHRSHGISPYAICIAVYTFERTIVSFWLTKTMIKCYYSDNNAQFIQVSFLPVLPTLCHSLSLFVAVVVLCVIFFAIHFGQTLNVVLSISQRMLFSSQFVCFMCFTSHTHTVIQTYQKRAEEVSEPSIDKISSSQPLSGWLAIFMMF